MRAVLMAVLVLVPLIGEPLMAQSGQAPPGRSILTAGQGAVASARTPAAVTIDAGDTKIAPQARIELSLAPVSNVDESYLVVVSIKPREGAARRIGTVSFYPPRAGVAQNFYFNASALAAADGAGPVELLVALAPAEQSQTVTAAVRVTGARLVGN